MSVKLPTLFLMATVASNAVSAGSPVDDFINATSGNTKTTNQPTCVAHATDRTFFGNQNIKSCIKDNFSKLESVTAIDNVYVLEGGDKIYIYDADDGHPKGRINLTWDTVQPEHSENDIPYNSLTRKAKMEFNSAIGAVCNNIAQNKHSVINQTHSEISAYYSEYPSMNNKNGVHIGIDKRKRNIDQFFEKHCL